MTSFTDLISKWHELMQLGAETQKLAESGITMVQEKRIEAITHDYITSLEAIQEKTDSASEAFAKRVLESNSGAGFQLEPTGVICERFLTSIGLVFRNQIPRSVSRKERLAVRTFEIHLDSENSVAKWPELNESFPLEDAIRMSADHFGGAEQELEDAITKQFLADLPAGLLEIPRLKLESNSKTMCAFSWEDANVPMGEHPEDGEDSEYESAPILAAFQDDAEFFRRRLNNGIQDSKFTGDISSQTQYEIDRTELATTDSVYISVRELFQETEESSGLEKEQLFSAISSMACLAVSASIPQKNRTLTKRRAKVVKSLNILQFESKASEAAEENQMEAV